MRFRFFVLLQLVHLAGCLLATSGELRTHVVVVLQSDEAVGNNAFHEERVLLWSLLGRFNPNLVKVAVLSSGSDVELRCNFSSLAEGRNAVFQANYQGSTGSNVAKALQSAQRLIYDADAARHSTVLLVSTHNLECPSALGSVQDPCPVVAQLQESGTVLVTLATKIQGTVWPKHSLAPSCLSLRTNETLDRQFEGAFERIRCTQVTSPGETGICAASCLERSLFLRPEDPTPPAMPTTLPSLATNERCSTNHTKANIDLVVMLDSSQGVGDNAFPEIKAVTNYILSEMNIGQSADQTRVAIINVGDRAHVIGGLSKFSSAADAVKALMNARYLNDREFDIVKGFRLAAQILESSTRPKMVLMWTSRHIHCNQIYADDPCHAAKTLEEGDIKLVSIDVFFGGMTSGTKSNIAPPCNRLSNMAPDLEEQVLGLVAKTSCHCGRSGWSLLEENCVAYKTCVYATGAPLNYSESEVACQTFGERLVSVHGPTMNDFVASIVQKNDLQTSWIGLRFHETTLQSVWADGSPAFVLPKLQTVLGIRPTKTSNRPRTTSPLRNAQKSIAAETGQWIIVIPQEAMRSVNTKRVMR